MSFSETIFPFRTASYIHSADKNYRISCRHLQQTGNLQGMQYIVRASEVCTEHFKGSFRVRGGDFLQKFVNNLNNKMISYLVEEADCNVCFASGPRAG